MRTVRGEGGGEWFPSYFYHRIFQVYSGVLQGVDVAVKAVDATATMRASLQNEVDLLPRPRGGGIRHSGGGRVVAPMPQVVSSSSRNSEWVFRFGFGDSEQLSETPRTPNTLSTRKPTPAAGGGWNPSGRHA